MLSFTSGFSYLDCYLYIDNGKLATRLYDKRDDFNFPIVNFPFLSSNIPSALAYGAYVSQLILYARPCSKFQDCIERGKVLTVAVPRIVSDVFANDKPCYFPKSRTYVLPETTLSSVQADRHGGRSYANQAKLTTCRRRMVTSFFWGLCLLVCTF